MQLSYGMRPHITGGIIVFGIGIPEHASQAEELESLRASFRRNNIFFIVMSSFTLLPMFALNRYFSLIFLYWWAWMGLGIWGGYRLFVKYHRAVARIKREHDWIMGERRVVRVDTTLISQKKQLTLSPFWCIAPFLLSLFVMFYSRRSSGELEVIMGIQAAGMTLLFFLLSLAIRRMRTKVYSADSAINTALNRAQRRYWSVLFLAMAILDAVFTAAVTLSGMETSARFDAAWHIFIGIQVAAPFAVANYTDRKMKEWSKRLDEADGRLFYTDDDEYWINGITYCNPNDRSMLVSKRTGTGFTLNMATRGGKVIMGVTLALVAIIIAGLAIFLFREDWMPPKLTVGMDGTVRVQSPSYGYSFQLDQIRELRLEDRLPDGTRTNGVATDSYARGHFRLDGWGNTRAYIFKHSPPYIVIRLADEYIVFNDRKASDTLRTFEELRR
ncbi:DUF5808 domain-containing protein [Paenibacillus rhizophilus]|uniref:DUF5808 domain-containing protein n=2 Tax=Paenibacillus rhizophilus TaxID=1850366 RepID=A0A3N9P9F1_9BACL|nr:DUF5808 domain-containing protein [Paenibacillus rhizophilus]RQW12449.1 hypothetical protein EH198_08910 [Paenibacillus rhizophilus]